MGILLPFASAPDCLITEARSGSEEDWYFKVFMDEPVLFTLPRDVSENDAGLRITPKTSLNDVDCGFATAPSITFLAPFCGDGKCVPAVSANGGGGTRSFSFVSKLAELVPTCSVLSGPGLASVWLEGD